PDLQRIGREERIRHAPGDATDLTAVAHGADVWIAWADSREAPNEGLADIYAAKIAGHDAKRIGDEIHVLGSVAHSHSPALAPFGKGVLAAWIEQAPAGASADNPLYGAVTVALDDAGRPIGEGARLAGLRP
ncbi:hypothetical protein, partial [Bradyrhizobium sp. NBAIM08]|uniref:hypothetical protein n=1 Tax=Bradyrhizobium sp. NBAIM08 TaxID=2793815 RepID=UPI001CD252A5